MNQTIACALHEDVLPPGGFQGCICQDVKLKQEKLVDVFSPLALTGLTQTLQHGSLHGQEAWSDSTARPYTVKQYEQAA